MHRATAFRGICSLLLSLSPFAVRASDFEVIYDTSGGLGNYTWSIGIEGAPAVSNPPLYIARGGVYTFAITTTGVHPFWIKTVQGAGSLNAYSGGGLSANGVTTTTTVTFDVPDNAPDRLYYNCGNHSSMTGPIHVVVFRNGFD
jgi:hypothetical protein